MKPIRDWTIKTRLSVAMMITSIAAVLLVGAVLIAFSIYRWRQEHIRDLHAIGHVLAGNAQAALVFDIPEDAEELLASLAVNQSIVLACIYDQNGAPFAVYRGVKAPPGLSPPPVRPEGHFFHGSYLSVFHTIQVDGQVIGTLVLQDDRASEAEMFRRDTLVWVLGMLLALGGAYFVAQYLQRVISRPILALAHIAETVGRERNYALRARKSGDDEIGRLMDSFNDMMSQIQEAQQALGRSEHRYRELVENIELGITLVDADHTVVMVNSAVGKMFRVEPHTLIGSKCFNKFEKGDHICSHCPGEKALQEHKPVDVETEGVRDDGSRFPVRIRAFPLFDEAGRPAGYIEVAEDVTERRAAEKTVRETEERFRDFFQSAPIGFHILGPDRLFVDINEAELEMIGYTREEVIGRKTWGDVIVPEQKDVFERHWAEVTSKGQVRNAEYTLVHKDGRLVHVMVNVSALFDEAGRCVRTRASVIDVSERKQMLGRLRESEAMLKNVLDTINVRVFWKDRDLRFRGCNRLFAEDAGLSEPDEIIGRTDFDLAWKVLAPTYRRDDQQIIDSGEQRLNYEEPQTTPDGKNVWLRTSKIPLRGEDDEIIGVLGTYEDVTERKRAELALRLSEQRFKAIANYTYDWELWISPQGHVLWTNPAVERITGYSVEEFMRLGRHPESVVYEDDLSAVSEVFQEALRGGSGKELEFRIQRKDGGVLWVTMSWQPIFDNKGVPQGHRESIEDISERKKAETALQESRERFRGLVESTSDWIWEIDTANRYTYVSPTVKDLLGYTPEEVLGKSPFDFMSAEEAARVGGSFNAIRQLCEPFRGLENVSLHKDGHEVVLETSGVPIYDAYGNFSGYRGIDRDITDRKQAEDRLRDTTQMLKLVLDAIPARVFWKDCNSVYIGCNRLFAQDAGIENPEDIAGKTDYDLPWTTAEAQAFVRDDHRVIETNQPEYHIIETQVQADGRRAWLETNKIPLHDWDGNVVGVLGSYEDITQRQLSEDAMRAIVLGTARATGEDFLRGLVRHLAAAVSCRYVLLAELVEPQADRLRSLAVWANDDYGANFEFAIKGTPFEHVVGLRRRTYPRDLRKQFPECDKIRDMGAESCVGIPLFDSAQRALGVLAVIHDKPLDRVEFVESVMSVFATRAAVEMERKQAEEERERLLRILEQKNRELESIVYTSSHDLRSTVVNVQGFSAELSATCGTLLGLLDEVPIPQDTLREELLTILHEDIPSELKYITASAAKMDMLISGLLKLSRLGRGRLNLQSVDMNELMQGVLDSMQFQLQQSQAQVRVEELPACTGDPDQLKQVFGNLVDNAVKYRDPARTPAITITAYPAEQMNVYCVADNGRGIAPRHQKNVFEVFHRLEPEGPVPGEGLGLSIVRRIVDRHGGKVWLESALGEGSKFCVSLPIA
ncbi:MAG: PAS domain S-box protein [Phycisphaerae bacterium]|nr:PAS domain S-box protein [Phycisphaerae bacterium]